MNLTPPPYHYLVRMPHSSTGHRYINRTANCKSTANRSVGDCSRSSTHAQTHGPSEIIIPPASSIGWAHRRRNGGRQTGSGNCLPHFSIRRGNQCKLPRHFNADFTKISSHLTEQLSSAFKVVILLQLLGVFPRTPQRSSTRGPREGVVSPRPLTLPLHFHTPSPVDGRRRKETAKYTQQFRILINKLSPRGRRDDMPPPMAVLLLADRRTFTDGYAVRTWLRCRQPACLRPRAAALWDRKTTAITHSPSAGENWRLDDAETQPSDRSV